MVIFKVILKFHKTLTKIKAMHTGSSVESCKLSIMTQGFNKYLRSAKHRARLVLSQIVIKFGGKIFDTNKPMTGKHNTTCKY